jgi:hypothetical protein
MSETMADWVAAMRAERFDEAWSIAEHSMAARDPATRDNPTLPYHLRWVWDGRAFDGRDVLVRCYHGLGDTIQFARYLPHLAARCASLTVEAPGRLVELLSPLTPHARFVAFDVAHPLPPAQCDLEITELDFALRMSPTSVAPPYLRVDPAPLPRRTMGFCHSSGDWDQERNVPEQLLAPFAGLGSSVTLVSAPSALDVLNPEGCPFDMAATASLVAGCELIITVDTMIAHLAGALGKPTWLMLKPDPDWRWNPAVDHSPWYPSMRLYAQARAGEWDDVVDRIARDLETWRG